LPRPSICGGVIYSPQKAFGDYARRPAAIPPWADERMGCGGGAGQMPRLESNMHVRMLEGARRRGKTEGRLYGLHWGDPDQEDHLKMVRKHYLSFFVNPSATVLEIGPGGGRWTRYMVNARHIYAVDYHQELLNELRKTHDRPNISFIKNNGSDFPTVPDECVDFLFSFGVFVHLDVDIIESYLSNMRRILKPTANVVLQYSDKTKPLAVQNEEFSDNTPEIMLGMIRSAGFTVQDDNRWMLSNSAIVRFTPQWS
jgi:phospholipid N-methyltransferase